MSELHEYKTVPSQEQETEKKASKFNVNKPLLKKVGIIAGSIIGALALVYVGFSVYFMSHFYFRSTVDGVNASGASASQVESRLKESIDGYSMTVTDEDSSETKISMKDVDMELNISQNEVEKLLDKQNGWAWIKYLFNPQDYVDESIVSLDQDKLAKKLKDFKCIGRETSTPTQDAKCVYKDGKFIVQKEVYGDSITLDDLTAKVAEYMTCLKPSFDVIEDKAYEQPKITADSKELQKLCKKLNKIADVNITYKVGSETEKVAKKDIVKWMSSDSEGNIAWDDEAMMEFVKGMASKYDTYGKPKQFVTSYNATVTLNSGNYGWKIDKEKEIAQLKADLEAGKDVTRDFKYSSTAASRGANEYGNSYIEVNLTAQHLYVYKNGSVALQSDFVSGNVYKGNATPTGAFAIQYKQKDRILRGQNYASHVNYWMPFNGGYGLHDASWRSVYGGSIYLTNGSHGCVNLPNSVAAKIYSIVDAGYPVFVYHLGGTESITSNLQQAKAVVELINQIGDPNALTSDQVLTDAEAAYNALPNVAKQAVTNYQTLVDARNIYNAKVAAAQAQAAQQQQAAQNNNSNSGSSNSNSGAGAGAGGDAGDATP